jgi:hypothetical protein
MVIEIAVASGAIDHREIMLRELPMSAEEAQDLSADWRSLDVSQIRHLGEVVCQGRVGCWGGPKRLS